VFRFLCYRKCWRLSSVEMLIRQQSHGRISGASLTTHSKSNKRTGNVSDLGDWTGSAHSPSWARWRDSSGGWGSPTRLVPLSVSKARSLSPFLSPPPLSTSKPAMLVASQDHEHLEIQIFRRPHQTKNRELQLKISWCGETPYFGNFMLQFNVLGMHTGETEENHEEPENSSCPDIKFEPTTSQVCSRRGNRFTRNFDLNINELRIV
jgi:hypothetical protein